MKTLDGIHQSRPAPLLLATALFAAGCATVTPIELTTARTSYARASNGPALQLLPAELHKAKVVLDTAEASFADEKASQKTIDLAYIADRTIQTVEAQAQTALAEQTVTKAKQDYLDKQGQVVKKTQATLVKTRLLLTDAQRGQAEQAEQAGVEHAAREAADTKAAASEQRALASEQKTIEANDALAKLAAKDEARGMVITLSGGVLFRSNEATLLPGAETRLDEVAVALIANGKPVGIEGYTDSRGSQSRNMDLSQRRAESVRTYLISARAPPGTGGGEGDGAGSPHRRQLQRRGAGQQPAGRDRGLQDCSVGSAQDELNSARDPKRFLKQVYQRYLSDGVADSAAALSYYFVFALFPFLFLLTTLTAYIPYFRASADMLMSRARDILPPQAMRLVSQHVEGLVATPRPRFLAVSLVLALYSASRGVDAVRTALNMAHDVEESRPFWKTEALAFGMTAGGTLLVLGAVTGLAAGGSAGFWLARRVGVAAPYLLAWRWLRWPVTAGAIALCAALGYHLLPDLGREARKFKLLTPGSLLGTVTWFLSTWGFAEYAAHFGSYNITYGAIGGVIVLMTWFYLTGFIFLMGGEINVIVEARSVTRDRV